MNRLLALLFVFSPNLLIAAERETNFFSDVLGQKGLLLVIGVVFFAYTYKNSVKLFAWIEDQTYGTRDFVLKHCELLFIEVKSDHVTYVLLFLSFGMSLIIMSVFFIFSKFLAGFIFGVIVAVLGWKIPRPFMKYLVGKRIQKFRGQMVDGLNLLSNAIRGGLSLPQAVGLVVEELPAPLSQEFNLILQQTRIGVPIDEAFKNFGDRVPTEDNDMFVSSISVLRESGGNLSEVFDTIADVIRERVRLQQKIDSFTAQGKAQASIIGAMPGTLLVYFSYTDPTFIDSLSSPVGIIVLIGAAILNVGGLILMFKMIKIDV